MQVLSRSTGIRVVRPTRPARRDLFVLRASATTAATTRVRYIKRPQESNLFLYTVPPPKEVNAVTNLSVDEVPMQVNDLRAVNHMTLQQNGFQLVDFPSGQGITWEDRQQVG